mmetsp:Transcript_7956/g.29432  ORF Transcript_7956/g.29432 Transcript_7956/m.29432 type:complete len:225 (+) Transcript_7956:3276-3950(+)
MPAESQFSTWRTSASCVTASWEAPCCSRKPRPLHCCWYIMSCWSAWSFRWRCCQTPLGSPASTASGDGRRCRRSSCCQFSCPECLQLFCWVLGTRAERSSSPPYEPGCGGCTRSRRGVACGALPAPAGWLATLHRPRLDPLVFSSCGGWLPSRVLLPLRHSQLNRVGLSPRSRKKSRYGSQEEGPRPRRPTTALPSSCLRLPSQRPSVWCCWRTSQWRAQSMAP